MRITYLDSSQCARSGSRQGITASARGFTFDCVGINGHAIVVRVGVVAVHGHSGVGSASSGQGEGLACRVIEVKRPSVCSLLYRDFSVSRGQVCGVGAAFQGVVALLGADVAVGSRNGDVGSRVQVYR